MINLTYKKVKSSSHSITLINSVSSMRFLITGQAIDGYSEQDDEIRFLGLW
ncbi:BnaC05g26570D [Brassica napus]|uniref:BnaC05g26570D protein n=3 Tax=Brassica TaxID=3705 RepID=A0A078EYW3_BRANA|nr:BnaC05g26570D [Brassica napus]VDD44559.1 unnamed protein product [Brassica oleracea]